MKLSVTHDHDIQIEEEKADKVIDSLLLVQNSSVTRLQERLIKFTALHIHQKQQFEVSTQWLSF